MPYKTFYLKRCKLITVYRHVCSQFDGCENSLLWSFWFGGLVWSFVKCSMIGFGFYSSASKGDYYERINRKYTENFRRSYDEIREVTLLNKSQNRGRRVSMLLVSWCIKYSGMFCVSACNIVERVEILLFLVSNSSIS